MGNSVVASDELRQAIGALYGSNTEHRCAADAYLKAARSREGFWLLALQLLTAQQSSPQEQFFAANALRIVAQRARDLLEPEVGRTLACQLAQLLVEAAGGQHWSIANQLAGTLAEIAIRSTWWPVDTLVSDSLHLLGAAHLCAKSAHHTGAAQHPQQACDSNRLRAVLLVLAALPEVCLSKDVSLHPDRRAAAAAALASCNANSQVVESALSHHASSACQLAALQLIQSWSTLPGSGAAALQLPPEIIAGLHQAVLASPAVATQAAEAVAALYSVCGAGYHPSSAALLQQLLPHLQGTVCTALRAAATATARQAQHVAQLLNAATTILSAAAHAVLARLNAAVAPGGGGYPVTSLCSHCNGGGGCGMDADGFLTLCQQQQQHLTLSQRELEQGMAGWGGSCPHCTSQWWQELSFVAGCLLELLKHPDVEVALSCLEPWDDSLLPGLGQLLGSCLQGTQQHAVFAQQAQQLLQRLCGALIQRVALPVEISGAEATADARDLPEDIRMVRKELSDTFRVAVSTLGAVQAVQHLLELAVHACTAWQAGGQPTQSWHDAECVLYALNLVLPKHLMQQAQQGGAAAEQGQRAATQALGVCLMALNPAAPKLAGTALTLLGGMSDALVAVAASSNSAAFSGSGSSSNISPTALLHQLLAALLVLLMCPDTKLSRNAATAVHRLCGNARLAVVLAVQHTTWMYRLAELYCQRGGLTEPPQGGEDLATEEFLRALCHLACASSGVTACAAGQSPAEAAGKLQSLAVQLLRQSAAQAAAGLLQAQQAGEQGGLLQPTAAVAAGVQQCSVQLEVISVVLETAISEQDNPRVLQQPLSEALGVAQAALQLLPELHQQCQHPQQHDGSHASRPPRALPPHLAPLLQGCCHAVTAAASAVPLLCAPQSALALLQPLLAAPLAHRCLLDALRAILGTVAAAAYYSPPRHDGHPSRQEQQACQQEGEALLPDLCHSVAAALQGAAPIIDDPEWAVAALRLAAEAARKLPLLSLPPQGPTAGAALLLQQLLELVHRGVQSYHREVCEATLDLAVALCCAAAAPPAVSSPLEGAPPVVAYLLDSGSVPLLSLQRQGEQQVEEERGRVAAQVVLWLLLGASGSMPPYMVQPIAEALHRVWVAVRSERFGGWLSRAVLELALPDASWMGWKKDALHATLADLLSQHSMENSRRFKRLLKVLCGGKKKGQHVAVPARGK